MNGTRIFLLAGLTSFAFAPILVRWAGDADPLWLAAGRTLIAAVIIQFVWWAKNRGQDFRHIWTRNSILAGLVLGLHFMLWISSVQLTSVASASVLVTAHPVFLILVEALFLKQRFKWTTWAGVVVAFGASVWLALADQSNASAFPLAWLGNTLALLAAVAFVVYALLGKSERKHHSWLNYVTVVYSMAAVFALPTALLLGHSENVHLSVLFLPALGLALGPQLLGHGSVNYALKTISPTFIGVAILAEPLFAAILAMWLFAEIPSLQSFLAMSAVMLGIVMAWREA